MKDFIHVLKRFLPPYKRYLVASIIMNVLSGLFSLLTFAFIKPILELLFGINETVYSFMAWNFDFFSLESWKSIPETLGNNFYWYLSQTIDLYGGSTALIFLGVLMIIATIFRTGTMYLSSYFLIPIRTGVVRDIRNQINDKILSLPLAFFSEERKGDIIARVSGDVNEVESSVMSSLDLLFKNPLLIVIYLTGMFYMSWQLTIFVLITLPIAGILMGRIGKKLKQKSALGQQQWGGLMAQIEETLGGLRIIKAFNAEDKVSKRFHDSNNTFRRTTKRIFRRQQLAHPVSEFLGTIIIAVVLWYGGSLILDGGSSLNGAGFISYLAIFYLLINPFKELSKAAYSIQKGLASMDRVDKILCAESNIIDPESPANIRLNDKIEYKNIWFKYREKWVLENINLTINKGQTIALVGQSGSGKSTLVDLLPRFYDVIDGSISIDGTDIRQGRIKDVRSLMGIVNQEAILFNDSFFNNIAFGVKDATQEEVEEAAKIANAYEFIMATDEGFQSNVGDRGSKLSGGQRQRISIARAILKNPPILILDEATSALDTESERLVQEALEKLMKNRTTIVIAHRLSTIRKADMICVMHEGKIVERGTHHELLALDGYYSRLCEMQSF
ncbi:ABC transporter ATP-binding protein/permease [Bacteroidales bacterium OttesenSCG-928-M11]|nr:ABC transporter ATP-binding protein/permease [Bacteroidales bacterium OttesenSCG-928-M11]